MQIIPSSSYNQRGMMKSKVIDYPLFEQHFVVINNAIRPAARASQ